MKPTPKQVKTQQEKAWARHVQALDELTRRQERRRRAAQRAKGGI